MKQGILCLFFLCGAFMAHAQEITVLDRETGQPLEAVTLVSDSPNVFAVTNFEGKAVLEAFRGASQIEIRSVGYARVVRSYAELEAVEFTIYLEASLLSLDQVVVSATRWTQRKRDVPARITTISPREVRLQNPQTAADLLDASGEVFIQKSQLGGGSPMIRGFSTNRLLYTVDGVRMNTAIFRSGNLQNVISLDPFAMESTEVFFGPGSVIYGSDAIGAVMAFQTLTPRFSTSERPRISGNAATRYASASNERTAHLDLNVGWKRWASVTSFSSHNFGDLRMGRYGPREYLRNGYVQRLNDSDVVVANEDPLVQTPTGYEQINLMQKIRFQPSRYWDLEYGFHYSTTSDVDRYDRLLRTRNGLPRSAEWRYGPQVWMMNLLRMTHNRPTRLYDRLSIRLAHQGFEESRIDRDFNDDIRTRRTEEVVALSANVDLVKTLGERSRLFYGAEAVVNEVASTGREENIRTGATAQGPARYPESTWGSYAAYVTLQWPVGQRWSFQSGLRYNQYTLESDFSNNENFYPLPFNTASLNNGAFTGSLGFVFNPAETWSIGASASTGFRSPNVDDIGKVFDSEPGAVVVPNPDLQAEYAYNIEVDIAKVFSDWLKVDVVGYYTLLDDALVRRNFQLNGQDSILYDGELSQVQAIQNAAQARVYGFQAGLEVKLPAGFGISSRFNYQVGEEELNNGTTNPSRHAAPWFGVTRLTYTTPRLELQGYVRYNGEVRFEDLPPGEAEKDFIYASDGNGNPYSPGWYTLNVKANYRLTEVFSVSGGVENLTDQRYRPYSSGIVAPGRNVILAVQARF
ncbi:MAG: TonB-dependent receptor [Leptolyngbya sp. SIO3F4]|nr:TonB-dependent receptor [Leptolyngbya sp. SIO3F4]